MKSYIELKFTQQQILEALTEKYSLPDDVNFDFTILYNDNNYEVGVLKISFYKDVDLKNKTIEDL